MPTFEVTAPDGKKYEVNAPEGATQAQAINFAKLQFGTLAHRAREENQLAQDRITYDPTSGMSGLDKLRAGTYKGMRDTAIGIGQLVNDTPESRAAYDNT